MSSESPKPVVTPRLVGWKLWVARLVMVGIGLFFALVVIEIGLRLFWPPTVMPRWVENAPYGIRRQLSNVHGFIITPLYRHRFSTDSRGFRGTDEYAIPKPPGVYRILALGDSVVDGYGVEDDETFCAKLQKKLAPVRRTEVMNLGIAGFGNAEELVQLENVGLEYQPDLVILGYFVNDHFENLTCGLYRLEDGKLVRNPKVEDMAFFLRDNLSRIPGYTFMCQHSYLVNYLRLKASTFFRGKVGQKHGAGGYTDSKPSEREVALTAVLVDEIIRVCTERGIKVVVLNIPMQENGVWMKNMPVDALKRKDQAKVVDVAAEVWNREPIFNIAHTEGYHPKPLGHELIADWLANYIKTDLWAQPKSAK